MKRIRGRGEGRRIRETHPGRFSVELQVFTELSIRINHVPFTNIVNRVDL